MRSSARGDLKNVVFKCVIFKGIVLRDFFRVGSNIEKETDLIIEYQEDLIVESGNCSNVEEAKVDDMSIDCPKDLKSTSKLLARHQ